MAEVKTYIVRLHEPLAEGEHSGQLRGVLHEVRTGRHATFTSAAQLLRLLAGIPSDVDEPSNAKPLTADVKLRRPTRPHDTLHPRHRRTGRHVMQATEKWRTAALVAVALLAGSVIGPPLVQAATAGLVTIQGAGSSHRAQVNSKGQLSVNPNKRIRLGRGLRLPGAQG
jgi:hypothetical protein